MCTCFIAAAPPYTYFPQWGWIIRTFLSGAGFQEHISMAVNSKQTETCTTGNTWFTMCIHVHKTMNIQITNTVRSTPHRGLDHSFVDVTERK